MPSRAGWVWGWRRPNRQYGEYAFALTLFSLPPSFLYPISVSLVPAISGALGQGDRRTARRHTRTALRMALLLALPSGIGLSSGGACSAAAVPRHGADRAAAAHHLRVLGHGCRVRVPDGVSARYFAGMGSRAHPVW